MRRRRFTEKQTFAVLKKAEGSRTGKELCRERGGSEQAFHRWSSKSGGLERSARLAAARGRERPTQAHGRGCSSGQSGVEGAHEKQIKGGSRGVGSVAASGHAVTARGFPRERQAGAPTVLRRRSATALTAQPDQDFGVAAAHCEGRVIKQRGRWTSCRTS